MECKMREVEMCVGARTICRLGSEGTFSVQSPLNAFKIMKSIATIP
jgi:hypothetical protein